MNFVLITGLLLKQIINEKTNHAMMCNKFNMPKAVTKTAGSGLFSESRYMVQADNKQIHTPIPSEPDAPKAAAVLLPGRRIPCMLR